MGGTSSLSTFWVRHVNRPSVFEFRLGNVQVLWQFRDELVLDDAEVEIRLGHDSGMGPFVAEVLQELDVEFVMCH